MPNIPEAIVAFLATASVGAIWSSCSPDFGPASVIDRFAQIEPKVLFAVDGYSYGGKRFDRRRRASPSCRSRCPARSSASVVLPCLGLDPGAGRAARRDSRWPEALGAELRDGFR